MLVVWVEDDAAGDVGGGIERAQCHVKRHSAFLVIVRFILFFQRAILKPLIASHRSSHRHVAWVTVDRYASPSPSLDISFSQASLLARFCPYSGEFAALARSSTLRPGSRALAYDLSLYSHPLTPDSGRRCPSHRNIEQRSQTTEVGVEWRI